MRDFKGMKRQRGRNRSGGNAGGKPQQHNANRAFDSNGPEGIKVRGNAQHVFEKYQQLARDAQTGGDRVLAENYLQHAEHYFRVIRAVTPSRSPADILGRDAVQSGYDIDFEDESGAQAYADAQEAESQANGGGQQQPQNGEGQNDGGQRENGQRQDYNNNQNQPRRDDRPFNRDNNNRDRDQNRYENRPRDDRPRDDRSRDDRPRDDRPRDDRPRDDRPRDDKPRRDRDDRPRFNRDDRGPREDRAPAADPMAVVEPQAMPLPRAEEPAASPILRSGDGEVSQAPNFLAARGPRKMVLTAPVEDAAEDTPKPKRRRAPKSFEGGDAPAKVEADEG